MQKNTVNNDEEKALRDKISGIDRKIVVLSGKGGVGKSTVSVNLALSLALLGKKVGLLDIDIHGPSIPTMLDMTQTRAVSDGYEILPVELGDIENLKVISIGFLLEKPDDAVIWRGPMKAGMIKQFLKDVKWGKLDFLIIDCPPGTGDEILSTVQLLGAGVEAVVVTTPQEVAAADVRKSLNFCVKLGLPVTGLIENMSGFVCPHCGRRTDIFKTGGGEKTARAFKVPYLGSIPIDPAVVDSGDEGLPLVKRLEHSQSAILFSAIAEKIIINNTLTNGIEKLQTTAEETMKIAVPVANGLLNAHFGHCDTFAIITADKTSKKITNREDVPAPPHEPGLLPKWLGEKGVETIITGGMGNKARSLFVEMEIEVVVGAPIETPEKLVESYLEGSLKTGENVCDH
ncbi:P-loop NTPase [candidate division WOR-3 bacterium]|nr:P-loop NTPase [candidate division WOR-3 bacterium]